ncbi:hypothetical protein [Bradyrhizobium sp. Bra64]|uniref:hypothetical protein n=1 Tax=Bradyrhizobium sp. Bra64 TaxID=2926009 RepID=UPI002117560F|nr:hypothetical protein [Bradyrhizobium sp. Bra64]
MSKSLSTDEIMGLLKAADPNTRRFLSLYLSTTTRGKTLRAAHTTRIAGWRTPMGHRMSSGLRFFSMCRRISDS